MVLITDMQKLSVLDNNVYNWPISTTNLNLQNVWDITIRKVVKNSKIRLH